MRWFGISFGEGNTKVGDVLTFSLPSKTTCPGASAWCLEHCYAQRYEKLRPICRKAYERNLALTGDANKFTETMIGVFPRIAPCMRLHVSGDFHTTPYILGWLQICSEFPGTNFWTYTRSWAVPELRDSLIRLRNLPNVELIASTDPTMPLPPDGWRMAFIEPDSRARGILCRHQTDCQDSCLACGYCFRQKGGDVIFKVH